MVLSTLMTLRNDSVNSVGKLEHVILQHQKVTIVILQKNNITYYVSVERNTKNLNKIISSMKKIV